MINLQNDLVEVVRKLILGEDLTDKENALVTYTTGLNDGSELEPKKKVEKKTETKKVEKKTEKKKIGAPKNKHVSEKPAVEKVNEVEEPKDPGGLSSFLDDENDDFLSLGAPAKTASAKKDNDINILDDDNDDMLGSIDKASEEDEDDIPMMAEIKEEGNAEVDDFLNAYLMED